MRLPHANAGQSFQEVTASKDAHLQRPDSVEMKRSDRITPRYVGS